MNEVNIFISVGGTANDKQENFVRAIEERLRSENLIPNTVGRNKFGAASPLKSIIELMDDCSGTIIVALERAYYPTGIEKRGGVKEKIISEIKTPTPWNQIEAALAYSKGQPIIVIVEEGIKSEGLLEKGYDWYVMRVRLEASYLSTPEFNGVLSSWKKKVEDYKSKSKIIKKKNNIDEIETLTIGNILKIMKPSSLWGILSAIAGLIATAFILGKCFAEHGM